MPRDNRGPHLVPVSSKGGPKYWYIRWTPAGSSRGRERSTGFKVVGRSEEISAGLALADFLVELAKAGPRTRREPHEIRISEVLESYLEEHAPKTAGDSGITATYNVDALLAWWGDKFVSDITSGQCAEYVAKRMVKLPLRKGETEADRRTRPASSETGARDLSTLAAALNYAVAERRLTVAPVIPLPEKLPGKDVWLTRDEVAALLRSARRMPIASTNLCKFILLAVYTGARTSAILGLTLDQLDLKKGRVNFNPEGRKRTKKKRPIQPLTNTIGWFVPRWMEKARTAGASTIIHDGPRPIAWIKKSFERAAANAGLDKKVTPHTLRHTAGTWMSQDGVDLWLVGGWLGHSHARTTELYAHHHPDYFKEAKAAMDSKKRRAAAASKSVSTGNLPGEAAAPVGED